MTCTTMAVLCGGKGTRLGKLTEHTPKSLVEVAGRPFLEWPLEHWAEQGITKVVLCVNHFGEQILKHFGGSFAGMDLLYSWDDGHGIDHALDCARPLLGASYWWTYGDTYLPISLKEPARSSFWRIWMTEDEPIDYGLYYVNPIHPRWPIEVPYEDRFHEINTPESLRETDAFLRRRLLGCDSRHAEPAGLESDRRLPDHPA